MKVAKYYSQQDIRTEEMPIPEVKSEEALVEMKACGICGSDLMEWYLKSRAPLVLGHEPAGVMTKLGNKVRSFEVGDRVFVHHHVADMICRFCKHGDYTLCKQFHETNIQPGGFAEYFMTPAPNLQLDTLKIPDNVSFEEATFIEPVGCCLRALKKCDLQEGDTVAIIGAGVTGLIHVALSKMYGASKIFVSDFFDRRLSVAKRMGADSAINPERDDFVEAVKTETDEGVDIAIVTAPSIEAYKSALNVCRKGGKLCVFAPTAPGSSLQISPKELFFSEIKIIPSYSTSHLETKAALQLIASGKLDVKPLITHRFKLTEAQEAFRTARESKDSLKVIIYNE